MMKKNEIIAFSMEYASYLMRKAIGIETIILFGSVARGDFDKESDTDIFVNIRNARKADKDIVRNPLKFVASHIAQKELIPSLFPFRAITADSMRASYNLGCYM